MTDDGCARPTEAIKAIKKEQQQKKIEKIAPHDPIIRVKAGRSATLSADK